MRKREGEGVRKVEGEGKSYKLLDLQGLKKLFQFFFFSFCKGITEAHNERK